MEAQQVSATETNWGVLAHMSALIGLVIPFGAILGPLVVWLTKGKEMAFVEVEAKEALNFQITMALAFLVACVLMWVLIGFLLVALLIVFDAIMVILAAVSASKGQPYRYPFALRLIK